MKLAAVFLVLSLIVLMAEPGEGFIHQIFSGLVNGIANGIYHSLNVIILQRKLCHRLGLAPPLCRSLFPCWCVAGLWGSLQLMIR
uniref:Uncharacterized protein n=1 Tax=Amphiprion percula TaxID=161767 RepID=A0A3P8SR65_AMPPE